MFALLKARLLRGSARPVASGRLATVGLTGVLVLLMGFAVLSAWTTYRASAVVSQASEISDAFSAARTATINEESLERKYRLEPGRDVRMRHARAAADLLVALDRVKRAGNPADVRQADAVQDLHAPYLLAIRHLFDAVDAGDPQRALKIDGDEVDPSFYQIDTMVNAAADAHHQTVLQELARLRTVESAALKFTPIVFALGIAAVIFFGLVLRSFRQQTLRAMTSEAATVRLSELRFRSLIQNASDVVLVCSQDGFITYQSPRAETAWNVASDALIGTPLVDLVAREDRLAVQSLIRDIETWPTSSHKMELELETPNGEWRFCEIVLTNLIEQPGIHGIVATLHDVTERQVFEQELKRRAFYDPLTKLANRALFSDRLEHALMRQGERVGLLFVDLDHFKLVNDGLNHEAGDRLLIEAAERLRACARATDTVARLGGDEFVVLVAELADDADALRIADRVVDAFQVPFHISDREIVVTASVGVAIGKAGEIHADALLRNADTAVYHAKGSGKARQVLFQPSMQVDDVARLQLDTDLRRALSRGELVVHYQPIVALSSLRIEGVEALVRWQHPTRGLLHPETFISVAEEIGLIGELGSFVLGEACRQMAAWHARLPEAAHVSVNVNVSPRQFQDAGFVADAKRALEQSGLPPAALILEITESAIMHDVEPTIAKLQQLKEMGVRLAIDDFGTGYSSLAYLKQLPIQVLKIDRSFIEGIVTDQEDAAIVRAIASLGRSLDLKVTAEGIETAAQASLLETWECDRGQGYYYARPADAAATEAMLISPAPFEELRRAA